MTVSVLHFTEDGDTSGFFPQLARRHDRARYRMHFGTLKRIDPRLADYMGSQGIPWFSGGVTGRFGYGAAAVRLATYLRRHRIDIAHTHLFDPSVVGLPTSAVTRTPVRVMTRHYSDYHTRIDKRWHVGLDRMCTHLSHGVIAVSEHTRQHLIGLEEAPADKVHTIHNGIDFDRVRTSTPDAPARVRRELDVGDRDLVLVPARLHPEKGHPYLFEALALAKTRLRRGIVAVLAGTGSFEADYRNRVRHLGIEDVVRFVGFRRDVCDLMASADLVVVPSMAEAFGLVLAEALYLGTPVLATRAGGIPEIVDDGVDGVLVDPGDSRALAEALVALLGDPARRRALAGQGKHKVAERFSFEGMVRAYESLYDELRGGGRRRQ